MNMHWSYVKYYKLLRLSKKKMRAFDLHNGRSRLSRLIKMFVVSAHFIVSRCDNLFNTIQTTNPQSFCVHEHNKSIVCIP